jgi:DNA-binding NarL/FixJ family response regulator
MPIRVCIFDDKKDVLDSLQLLLHGTNGIEVTGVYENANNLKEALIASEPDIVLMDIGMPGSNGIEATWQIKNFKPAITIIMQTIFEDEDRIFSSILAGASGYLTKDAPPLTIIEAVQDAYKGGAPMTPCIAKKIIQQFQLQNKTVSNDVYNLTSKETEVLRSLADGFSYKMIGDKLSMGYDTVHTHIKSIYRKLHVSSMGEAISKAIRGRII